MKKQLLFFAAAVALAGYSVGPSHAQKGAIVQAREGIEFFEAKIRPVLAKHCYECHSAKSSKVKAALYLDSRTGILTGGDHGPAIVAGDPNKSLLIKALRHEGDYKMPKEKLPDSVIADFVQWVKMGAPDPRTTDTASWKKLTLEDAKSHWSFKPMQKRPAPKVKDTSWPRSDVDRFILGPLEAKGLTPAKDADRATLLRRLTLDLIGLPPTPEQVDAFVADKSPDAYEKIVDRLLASQHFGERWGRYWLDIARYAESNGNADNTPFPHAWRYRDYVIKSFNDDKPYNRFISEQVAGDLLATKDAKEKDANLVATGLLALTSKPRAQNNPDYRMDLVADQLDVTCRAVMSMTIICARCHDHKFDPISTKDYYALAGIFDSSIMLSGTAAKGAKKGGGAGLHALSTGDEAMGVKEGPPTDVAICIRGDSTKRGPVVSRGFLTVALTTDTKPVNRAQSGRLELAAWLTQLDHPLTSRVAVNRIWQHLFGQGLSRVVDNFGLHGEVPTHPELLDNLALQFQADGWSVKKMIRRLVLTRTYQQASTYQAAHFKADPDNRLFWSTQPRRLDAEAIRDSMLFVSGALEVTPPHKSTSTGGIVPKKKKAAVSVKENPYRSIYLPIIRNNLPESLAVFDVADPSLIVGQREVTTVPAQALYLMNSPIVLDLSRAFAGRLTSRNIEDSDRVDLAFRIAYSRLPSAREREQVLAYVKDVQKGTGRNAAWQSVCQTLLASAEFRYLQ
ncbi:MAG: PSD1 domain-containing protein [Planctomycetes bacterium]|nr:PSD1 domain-containing protein [Planctomycetota bacterium]